jgi:hypothetical protein
MPTQAQANGETLGRRRLSQSAGSSSPSVTGESSRKHHERQRIPRLKNVLLGIHSHNLPLQSLSPWPLRLEQKTYAALCYSAESGSDPYFGLHTASAFPSNIRCDR